MKAGYGKKNPSHPIIWISKIIFQAKNYSGKDLATLSVIILLWFLKFFSEGNAKILVIIYIDNLHTRT